MFLLCKIQCSDNSCHLLNALEENFRLQTIHLKQQTDDASQPQPDGKHTCIYICTTMWTLAAMFTVSIYTKKAANEGHLFVLFYLQEHNYTFISHVSQAISPNYVV